MAGPETVASLLEWYDRERRDLPWRAAPGRRPDAYRVWLSEIMLQQTTVGAVIPYYERFLRRWPDVAALAAADLDDVLAAWAGLGYYSRARNLHKCAKLVATEHGGRFPDTPEALGELPGIGPYTAAAIAAIAFGAAAMPVDGNIERVTARLFAAKDALPGAKAKIRRLAQSLTPAKRAGDFAQAMMDLGATVCTPRRPSCLMCPLERDCAAHAEGIEALLPAKAAKPERPLRVGIAFLALREDGRVLLRRRAEAGLLGGMLEVPSTEWNDILPPIEEALRAAPVRAEWWAVPGTVTHTFTHFRLEMMVYRAVVPAESSLTFWADPQRCSWVARHDLSAQALPSVMRKIIGHGLKEQ
ncbi:MAG: A/G-specific adenine glycosylase [Hyphomicrobiaceae bacterium]|nr:MAG: A/G-specific adenine glycosylase [Hyphomicrobiaceae bacterium]